MFIVNSSSYLYDIIMGFNKFKFTNHGRVGMFPLKIALEDGFTKNLPKQYYIRLLEDPNNKLWQPALCVINHYDPEFKLLMHLDNMLNRR